MSINDYVTVSSSSPTYTPHSAQSGTSSAFDGTLAPAAAALSEVVPSGVSKTMLGTLGDDLYIFGNADSVNTGLEGVRRLKASAPTTLETLTTAVTPGTHQFSGSKGWPGVVQFKDKLYVGATSGGRLFRLDLTAGGAFTALTQMSLSAGGEDVHAGPVLWGYLYLATYGHAASDTGPNVYKWDGITATATLVKKFTNVGDDGLVQTMAVVDGVLYVGVNGPQSTGANSYEMWSIDRNDVCTLLESSVAANFQRHMTEWRGELVSLRGDGTAEPLKGWDGSAWVTLSPSNGPQYVNGLFTIGDELYAFDYYTALWRYRDGDWDNLWDGIYQGVQAYGFNQPIVWGGDLYFTSEQGTQTVWKLPLGTGRALRSLSKPQKSSAIRRRLGAIRKYGTGVYFAAPARVIGAAIPAEAEVGYGPLDFDMPVTLVRISIDVTVLGTAGAVVRLGLHDQGADSLPDALVLDAGTVVATSTGTKEVTISKPVAPGRYFGSAVVQGAAGTRPTIRQNQDPGLDLGNTLSAANLSQFGVGGYTEAAVAGAFPANTGTIAMTNVSPRVVVRT